MEYKIGINQRIPIEILEMALTSVLNGTYTDSYASELAMAEFHGPNRIKKSTIIISKIITKNPFLDFLIQHKEDIMSALRYKADKALILIALVNTVYPFGYDVTALLGKYFHVQNQVSMDLITAKTSAKYGSNRSLVNGLYCILPMMIDAGLLSRPKVGVYEICKLKPRTEIAIVLYKKSYLQNNPYLSEDCDYENDPYFEYIV